MTGLRDRLARLEQHHPPGRCAVCRGWPGTRVVWPDAEGQALADRYQPINVPVAQERCPACGWEPVPITVVYTDPEQWRHLT